MSHEESVSRREEMDDQLCQYSTKWLKNKAKQNRGLRIIFWIWQDGGLY